MLTPRAVCEFPCPAIDRALSAGRRLARLAGPSCEAEARALVDALEVVRAENAQMRAAHAEAVERVRRA